MTDNFCFECGTALRPNAKFCSSCGISLAEDAVENPPTPAPEPTEEKVKIVENKPQPFLFHISFGIGGAFIVGFIAASNGMNGGGFGILGFWIGTVAGYIVWNAFGFGKPSTVSTTPEAPEIPAVEPVPAEKTEMEPIEKEPDYSWDLMAPTPKNEVELANKSKDEKPSEITDAEMEKEQLEIEQWHDAFKVGGFIFTALIGVVVFAALIGTCSSVPQ